MAASTNASKSAAASVRFTACRRIRRLQMLLKGMERAIHRAGGVARRGGIDPRQHPGLALLHRQRRQPLGNSQRNLVADQNCGGDFARSQQRQSIQVHSIKGADIRSRGQHRLDDRRRRRGMAQHQRRQPIDPSLACLATEHDASLEMVILERERAGSAAMISAVIRENWLT